MAETEMNNNEELQSLHSGWLKGLALELVGDEGIAHDLAYDTLEIFVAADRSAVRNPKSYMQRILRRLVYRRRVSELRRAWRERGASRFEALPSAAEIAEQLETQRVLIEELQALGESSREVLVLRFQHELSAVEIAARLNVPAPTVRKRQSRALAELRERLDRKYPDRRSWAVAMMGLVDTKPGQVSSKPAALSIAGLVATKVLSPAALLVVACGGLLLGLYALRAPSPHATPSLALEQSEQPAPDAVKSEPVVALPTTTNRVSAEPTPVDTSTSELLADPALATIRGLLQLTGGAPAAGAEIAVTQRGAADEGSAVRGTADSSGLFEIQFVPGSGISFDTYELRASYPAHVDVQSGVFRVVRGGTVDIGVLVLAEPGVVLARVVDARGETLTEGWRVSGRALGSESDVSSRGVLNSSTGVFRLEGMGSGDVSVRATAWNMGARTDPLVFPLQPWEETRATLMYSGPDLTQRIAVRARYSSVLLGQLDGSSVSLQNDRGETVHGKPVEWSRSMYVFDGLAPGSYSVRVADERFLPWSLDGVQPGESVTARLTGSAALRLTVVDAGTGEAVEGAEFWGDPRNPASFEWSQRRFELPAGELQSDGALLVRGLIPSSFDVVARVAGHPEARAEVRGLLPGEERPVTVRLHRTPPMRGRVLEADGVTPAVGILVQRTSGSQPGWSDGSPVQTSAGGIPAVDDYAQTDDQGRFQFEGLSASTHTLRAMRGAWLVADLRVEWSAESRDEVLLTLPPFGWLEGKVLIPESRELWELTLYFSFRDESGRRRVDPTLISELAGGDLNPDGSFRIGPLPAGVVGLWYQCDGDGRTVHGMPNGIQLGEILIRAGETTFETFDQRETFPGLMRVRVHVDGELQESGYIEINHVDVTSGIGWGFTDGFAVAGMIPGRWKITYSPPGSAWRYCSDKHWMVHAGEVTEADVHVTQIAGQVLMVDEASAAPLRGVAVSWRVEGRPSIFGKPSSHLASGVTDENGFLEVRQPEGEYRFYRGAQAQWDDQHRVVTWPLKSNESQIALP